MVGIYKITNTANRKFYIGSSIVCNKRQQVHFSRLKHGKHANKHLQAAWNKYGSDKFTFEVIAVLPDDVSVNLIERIEFDFISALNPHYNKTTVTTRSGNGKKLNKNDREPMTPDQFKAKMKAICSTIEHREKLSIAVKTQYNTLSEDQKKARNAHKIGRVFTEETRKILSEKAKKRKWSDAIKQKIANSLKKRS